MTAVVYSDVKHAYAEVRPCDGEWLWTGLPEHATPMTAPEAHALVATLDVPARVVADPYHRRSYFEPRPNHPHHLLRHAEPRCESRSEVA